ncbi:MAG: site-specific integrase [Clostridia bacterium]
MATIKKRKDKFVVIYDYIDKYGNRKQKWQTCATKAEAQKVKAKIEYEKTCEQFVNPNNQTFEEFVMDWAELYAKSHWQYNTYSSSMGLIKNHIIPIIGNMPIQKIGPRDIEKLYDTLRTKKVSGSKSFNKADEDIPCLTSTTIRHVHSIVKCAFDKAVEWNIINKTPVICDAPKKNVAEKTIWDTYSFKIALQNMDHRLLHLAVHLAFICSLRIGETMALTWDCVDFDNNCIIINKTIQRVDKEALKLLPTDTLIRIFPQADDTKKSVLILKDPKTKTSVRKCFLPEPLKEELLMQKEHQRKEKIFAEEIYTDYDLVFALEIGSPVEPNLCEKWFKKWQQRTPLDLPKIIFHEIRHSSTTYKLSLSNGDIKSVQGDTGLATADMVTNTYSHIVEKSRINMMSLVEDDFYNDFNEESKDFTEIDEIEELLALAKNNPNFREKLLFALVAQK